MQQQNELSSKWREESRSNLLHFRRVVSDLKKENSRLSGRNAELENKGKPRVALVLSACGFQ